MLPEVCSRLVTKYDEFGGSLVLKQQLVLEPDQSHISERTLAAHRYEAISSETPNKNSYLSSTSGEKRL